MNKPSLIIYGCGSIAKSLFRYLQRTYTIECFTVDRVYLEQLEGDDFLYSEEQQQWQFEKTALAWHKNIPIFPFESISSEFPPSKSRLIVTVGYVQMNHIREQRIELAKEMGYELINYVHPSVVLDESIKLGENIIILEYATIHPYSSVGTGCFISSNVNVGDRCEIGGNCWINAGVGIAGGTKVGDNCFFGVNATLGNNICIGSSVFIGANTFVGHDTNDGEVYISPQAEKIRMNSKAFMVFSKL